MAKKSKFVTLLKVLSSVLSQSPPKFKRHTVLVLQALVNNSSAPMILKFHSSFPLVFCSKWVILAMLVLKDSCFPFINLVASPCSFTTLPGVWKPDLHATVKIWAHQSCTPQQNTEQIFSVLFSVPFDDAQHFKSFFGWCCYTLSWWYRGIVDDDSRPLLVQPCQNSCWTLPVWHAWDSSCL